MKNNTAMKNAAVCVASERLRRAGQRHVAPTRFGVRGTVVSIALPSALPIAVARLAAFDSSFTGVVGIATGATFAYKTSDVARSLRGRPPV